MQIAVRNDVRGKVGVQPGDAGEQRHRGGVHIDADGVDAVLDDGVERLCQTCLRHVVLVLADADGFRFDLDQFGERVLQAAGNGNRTAQADIQFREFLGRECRGGVDRGAGFGDHDLGQLHRRVALHQVSHQLVGFTRGGAVADTDQLDLVLGAQRGQHVQ